MEGELIAPKEKQGIYQICMAFWVTRLTNIEISEQDKLKGT